ncbi:MarR family transcriptional regulator [Halobacillus shinanisalinarum]|uniref:MarR family transcriptional regulator n=1 Tax=Halobacillus shinanisalinarum TaxID=2932258 RepID=A0ABY4GZ70_9BACI|nr:MarR family transcriptional regulator [Halobacillus shinanisalinarum]UOQ93491.1 MarR family transcriptional regulator [Halobacillus shinanisalinarum]
MEHHNHIDHDSSLKSFIVLSRAYRSVEEKIREDIRTYGLNPTEFAVLELLYHKGEQPIQQIGKKILLASGSITYVVDKLEGKKLLQRVRCPKDRRVIYADITNGGKKLMDEIFPKHQAAIKGIFGELSENEQKTLIILLKRLGLSLKD